MCIPLRFSIIQHGRNSFLQKRVLYTVQSCYSEWSSWNTSMNNGQTKTERYACTRSVREHAIIVGGVDGLLFTHNNEQRYKTLGKRIVNIVHKYFRRKSPVFRNAYLLKILYGNYDSNKTIRIYSKMYRIVSDE